MDEKRFLSALAPLTKELQTMLYTHRSRIEDTVYEITLRRDKPVCIETSSGRVYLTENGCLTDTYSSQPMTVADKEMLAEVFENICDYSVYSRQREINNGYITIDGGHRVGICGTAVVQDGHIVNIKNLSSMSIRIHREIIGCSDELIARIDMSGGVLLCGAPSSGKTTLIRDIARTMSAHHRVSVIDERNELSATVRGVAQNDLGMCDVFVGYPKREGMLQAVRSMSPHYIICDELGNEEDNAAVRYCGNAGCAMIASLHTDSPDRLRHKSIFHHLIQERMFGTVVFLWGRERVGVIRDVLSVDALC